MLAYQFYKIKAKINFETCLVTLGARTGGLLITSGDNRKSCRKTNRYLI